MWAGSAVVTINSKLLGGQLSFFQSVCVLGYCSAPLVLASGKRIHALFISPSLAITLILSNLILRSIICLVTLAWSIYGISSFSHLHPLASLNFIGDSNLDKRRVLALYPMILFYFVLAWMVLISKGWF